MAIDLPPEGVAECIDKAGVGFMFAPSYHPAMKVVVPVRKSLRVSILCFQETYLAESRIRSIGHWALTSTASDRTICTGMRKHSSK